jgi:DNA-binding PadR family transcriptional regulator
LSKNDSLLSTTGARFASRSRAVSAEARGPRRRFTITARGRDYLAEQRDELDRILAQMRQTAALIEQSAIDEFRAKLFEKMRNGPLTTEQANRLRDELRNAREEIENV